MAQAEALFDDFFPLGEQLPRTFDAVFCDENSKLHLFFNSERVGDQLTDKARVSDGYRFHDAFHLSNAAILGWSPVLRSLLGRRRQSAPLINDVEDGGRAKMIEEAICHVIYDYGRDKYIEGAGSIDPKFAAYLKRLAAGLEVESRSVEDWINAITAGHEVFNRLRAAGGGRVHGNLIEKTLQFYLH